MNIDIEKDSPLDKAATEFLAAGEKYREFLKKNYPEQLHGVIWVTAGYSSVMFSESEKYTNQIKRLSWDSTVDQFNLPIAN